MRATVLFYSYLTEWIRGSLLTILFYSKLTVPIPTLRAHHTERSEFILFRLGEAQRNRNFLYSTLSDTPA